MPAFSAIVSKRRSMVQIFQCQILVSRSFEIRIILNILLQLLSVGAEQIFTLWGGVQLIIYERGRKYDPTT